MKHAFAGLAGVFVFLICALLHANVLFEDQFTSAANWVNASTGTPSYQTSIEDGKVVITANAASDAYLKHSIPCDKFSYSVNFKVKSGNAQLCGITFCWQSDFQGYAFVIQEKKQYSLIKWVKSGMNLTGTSIATNWNSFVNIGDDNTLTVVKNNDKISLFCNGVFLEKVTDNTFNRGDVGITAGKGEKVQFKQAYLTDEVSEGQALTWFSDKFNDGKLNNWRQLIGIGGNATVTEDNTGCRINSGDSMVIFYTNGNYTQVPCTTIATCNSGSGLYGISLLDFRPNIAVNYYNYVINSSKNYAVIVSGQNSEVLSNSNIHGTTDTIVVADNYQMYVNGFKMTHAIPSANFTFNAAGFFVFPKADVSFRSFSVGRNTGIGIKQNKPVVFNTGKGHKAFVLGGPGLIYDIKGRQVAAVNGKKKIEDQLRTLGAGSYIIIEKGKKEHIIQRAIINVK